MKLILLNSLLLVCAGAFASRAADLPLIKPGEIWPDERGQHVQAHGGGILKLGDIYYWFGEDRGQNLDRGSCHVSCYASTNLADWKFCRDVLNLVAPTNYGGRLVLERPKVFHNAPTKKFVMYFHMDDGRYKVASVGVAVSDTVDGDYGGHSDPVNGESIAACLPWPRSQPGCRRRNPIPQAFSGGWNARPKSNCTSRCPASPQCFMKWAFPSRRPGTNGTTTSRRKSH